MIMNSYILYINHQNLSMPDNFEEQNDKKQVLNDLKVAADR